MDVRCERCRAQYVFDDDQVTPTGLTVQCTNCGHLFLVKKKELFVTVPVKADAVDPSKVAAPRPPAPAAAPAAPPPWPAGAAPAARSTGSVPAVQAVPPPQVGEPERAREWRVRQANGNIFTFRELTTLQKWIIEQKVGRDDEISLAGDQAWKRLGNIAELASFFQVVEAAERTRTQPALTPLPMPAVPAPPAYGVGLQTPGLFPPPPPSGFPPPSFAAQPPAAAAMGAPFAAAPVPAPAPARPAAEPAALDVDLGDDLEPPRRRRWPWVVAGLAVVVGAAAAVVLPRLLAPPPPPPVVERPPEPPPAVPAPLPVVEAPVAPPPEPIAEPPPPPPPRAAPRGPKALLAQAHRLLEKGDAEAALDLFGQVASDDPENADALTGRGLCYLDLEKWAPAEESFLSALQVEPDQPDALLGLAETYRFQGKKAEAISQYEKYLARHPGGEEAEVARNALDELRK